MICSGDYAYVLVVLYCSREKESIVMDGDW